MEVAGPSRSLQSSFLDYLDLLQCELQQEVLHLLKTRELHALRRVSKLARDLVNKYVRSLNINTQDLDIKYWLLHTRFATLRTLAIRDGAYSLRDAGFADFTATQLKLLKRIVELDLSECRMLSTASVATVASCCAQLESLNLPNSENINDSALEALTSLTRLSKLNLDRSSVSSGLQHLTQLKQLQELSLSYCSKVQDADLQHLTDFSNLTSLNVSDTNTTGTNLMALSHLKRLRSDDDSLSTAGLVSLAQMTQLTSLVLSGHLHVEWSPAQLAQLSSLVNMRQLKLWSTVFSGEALALLNLPSLELVVADKIITSVHDPNLGSSITKLVLQRTAEQLRTLLPLRSLRSLMLDYFTSNAQAHIGTIARQPDLEHLGLFGLQQQADELSADLSSMLQGLKQLRKLELRGFLALDEGFLLAVASLQRLEELWLDQLELPGGSFSVLQRCSALRKVTLQDCRGVGREGLLALVAKRGMEEVVVHSTRHGVDMEQVCVSLRPLATGWGCDLMYTEQYYDPIVTIL